MSLPLQPLTEIRDPIHGAIPVDAAELAVIDHRFVQRLRGIRQLGFSHLPFPGATHTRYSHSVGVLHLAGRAFDACFRDAPFSRPDIGDAYRHCLRLAALCHDLGHGPFSHAAEFAMPRLRELGIDAYIPAKVAHRLDQRASHEDYTIAILTRSGLADVIREHFPFGPEHVAALVSSEVTVPDDFFVDGGHDHRGLLSQLISSDLDCDRLDYLVRDSTFTGARYGQVDVNWLISNLTRHIDDQGRVCLALDGRAVFAFDDFMVARFHMFVMVYFHRKSLSYEHMLQRFMADPSCTWRLPADLDHWLDCDDAQLLHHLRQSDSEWARRLIEGRPFQVALEVQGRTDEIELGVPRKALEAAGIDVIEASSVGAVFGPHKPGRLPMVVIDQLPGHPRRALPIEQATLIFDRYHHEHCIGRLYVPPERLIEARALLEGTG